MKTYTVETLPNTAGQGAQLRLSGYASIFNKPDLSGDIVRRGAFAPSLIKLAGGGLPMLLGHETGAPIGVWDRIIEDGSGLFVSGRIIGGEPRSERTMALVRAGALSGLSIGYRPVRARKTASGRELLELDLWEVSIVAFPMLRAARITQIGDISTPTPSHSQQGEIL